MREIEILVEVFSPKEEVLRVLNRFESIGRKTVVDNYFFDPKREDLKPDTKGGLTRSFRLRKKEEKTFLTYKMDNFNDRGIWTYSDEHEVVVDSFEETRIILKHLGLEPLVLVENTKHIFLSEKYEVILEDVKNLGLFMEVEYLDHDDQRPVEEIKKEIQSFLSGLGIKISEECQMGKPELMLRKFPLRLS